MSMLFYVDDLQNILLHPEIVKLCPSLATLTEKEVVYIVKAYDYEGPYKQFPENDRRRKAMFDAFGENEHDLINSQRILDAAQDYVSLQYSTKIETCKIYQQKIDKYQQQLLVDENPSSTKKICDAIDDLTKRIAVLRGDYDKEIQRNGVIKGKMDLSRLEKCMANRNHWLSIIDKNKK